MKRIVILDKGVEKKDLTDGKCCANPANSAHM